MATQATPARDRDGTATTRRARSSPPGPQAGRRGPVRQLPRRRPPAGETPADGSDQDGAEAVPGDYGLFGPESATWHLMGEPIL
jgi:hypothetical protein